MVRALTWPWILYWGLLALALVGTALAGWAQSGEVVVSRRLGYQLVSIAASVLFCVWRGGAAFKLYQLRAEAYLTFRNGLLHQVLPLGVAALGGPIAAVGLLVTTDAVSVWQLSLCGCATVGGVVGLALHRRTLAMLDDPAVKRMLVARARGET